jgi:hypothetical protein
VPQDLAKGIALFEKGCRLGSTVSCQNRDLLRDAHNL